MEKLLIFFPSFLLAILSLSCDGSKKEGTTYIDIESIKSIYLRNCAWQNDIHSEEWQICLDSAIIKNPKYSYLYQQKAMPFIKSGDYYNAVKNLNESVMIDNKYLDYRAFTKLIFFRDYDGAIKDFKSVQEIYPNSHIMDHDYNFYLALAYLMKNELETSNYYFSKSFESESQHGSDWVHYLNYYYYSILKLKMNNINSAMEAINMCLDSYSEFPDAQYWKSYLLLKMNKKEEALSLSKQSFLNLKKGNTNNEANEKYINYPYQISETEIIGLIKKIENDDK